MADKQMIAATLYAGVLNGMLASNVWDHTDMLSTAEKIVKDAMKRITIYPDENTVDCVESQDGYWDPVSKEYVLSIDDGNED